MGNLKSSRIYKYFDNNRRMHEAFRSSYTDKQNKTMIFIASTCGIYSMVGYFILGNVFMLSQRNAHIVYLLMLSCSVVAVILSMCGGSSRIIRNKATRERVGEIISTTNAIMYLTWGFIYMGFSMIEHRDTNYIVLLMVYSVCSMFLYFSFQHYVALYLMCVIAAFVLVGIYKPDTYDKGLLFNVVLFGMILTIGGIVKYQAAERKFLADMEATNLRENLEANNEELIAANVELEETAERLKNHIESQRLFTASMNHELRSPLNGIIGLLQILKDDKALSPVAQANVRDAYASSETLIGIVNDLLDFAKLEAGEFVISEDEFELKQVVSNIESIERSPAEAKGLNLILDVDGDTPNLLMGDGLRIQQVAVNLVSNGIKYTEHGTVRMHMFMDTKDCLNIAVEDTGQGIEPKAQEALFMPFVRANEKRNKYIQGTGLGLTIVKNLVTQMKGEISVSSMVGKGSTFTVKIPVRIMNRNLKYGESEISEKKKETEIPNLEGVNLLCVDDSAVNLVVFKGLYAGTNAQVKTLADGRALLEEIKHTKYDIIFLDHMMPGMDGIEVFERMKAMSREENLNCDTPVIMLTANAGAEAEKSYLAMGFHGYLSKPVLKDSLLKLTVDLLRV